MTARSPAAIEHRLAYYRKRDATPARRAYNHECKRQRRADRAFTWVDPVAFESHIDRSGGPTACHEYQGLLDREGYGRYGSTSAPAHRVEWTLKHGPIPTGLFVLHHCDNPPCCNDRHLFLGTQLDNGRDKARKGRARNRYTGRIRS